jgi:choline dehydrogenase
VVGAGSAGCVLADRLSASGDHNVLLVEAGAVEPRTLPEVRIPMLFPRLFGSEVDWGYTTVPQAALDGRLIPFPRGKGLGGSSAINAQLWTVGHRADYDGWADAGCTGWGYADVLPYFEKAVNERLPLAGIRYPSPVTADFVTACVRAGHTPAAEQQEGVLLARANHVDGMRHSSAEAYLGASRQRPNLTVLTAALARRVVFEGTRATGVEIESGGDVHILRAAREVVLAAGAVGTPHLLMLSGVGPADHLTEHGLPVVSDVPQVGRNLADHMIVPLAFAARDFESPGVNAGPEEIDCCLRDRVGPLNSINSEALVFLRTSPKLPAPDIEVAFLMLPYGEHKHRAEHGFALGVMLLRPHSTGTVTLKSADPHEAPLIDPAYLSDPAGADLATTIAGIRAAQRIAREPVLARWRGEELTEGALSDDEAEIERYVRSTALSLFHPVSTCRMGPDAGAPVGLDFRMRGTTGLRVVDASAMPSIVRAHTHAPVTMLAERAAETLLADP